MKNSFRFGFDGDNCLMTGAKQMKCSLKIIVNMSTRYVSNIV